MTNDNESASKMAFENSSSQGDVILMEVHKIDVAMKAVLRELEQAKLNKGDK